MKFTKMSELLVINSENVNNAMLKLLTRGKKSLKIELIPLYDKYFVMKEEILDGKFERREKRKNLTKIISNSENFLENLLLIFKKKNPELVILKNNASVKWFNQIINFLREIYGNNKVLFVSFSNKNENTCDLIVSQNGLYWN